MAHATRDNLGYLLAKASQRWNEQLQQAFAEAGYPEVRASYGSVLIPLLEEDGLRMGEIARRARLSKQTMTTMVRLCERDGLVERRPDPGDGRATRVHLSAKARSFQPTAEHVLAELERDATSSLGERRLSELRRSLKQLSGCCRTQARGRVSNQGEPDGERSSPNTRMPMPTPDPDCTPIGRGQRESGPSCS